MFRIFRLSFSQIEKSGKYSIFGFSILRMLVGLLDLVGIGFVGLILTWALHSQSQDAKLGTPVSTILNVFKIGDASLIRQLIV